jgi:hypothetical protein
MDGLSVFVSSGIFKFNGIRTVGAHKEFGIGKVGHRIASGAVPRILGSCVTCPIIND